MGPMLDELEVPEIDGLLRAFGQKVAYQGLVFGLHGAQQHRGAVPHHPVAFVLVGIGRNDEVAGGRHRGRFNDQPGVHRHEPAAGYEQGVEVHLHDLGKVGDQLGNAHQNLPQLVQVHGRGMSVPLEDPGDPGALNDPPSQEQIQGR